MTATQGTLHLFDPLSTLTVIPPAEGAHDMEIPGHGDIDLKLATCSYRAFRPEMGVPVRTSVGHPRGAWRPGMPHLEYVKELAPHGLRTIEDRSVFEPAYRALVASNGPAMLGRLVELSLDHPGETLVILCFENVHLPGQWCHRSIAAAYLEEQLGITIPELSPMTGVPA